MALAFKVGAVTSSGSSGNQAVTGVGFQPKALILFGTNAAGVNTFAVMHFGAMISGSQMYIEGRSNHGASAADNAIAANNTTVYHRASFGASLVGPSGTISSLDSDGFTITWSAGHTAFPFKYIALGGADLTNLHLDQRQVPGSTGDHAYTGVGFQPDALICFGISHTAGNAGRDTDPLSWFIGFSDGTDDACVTSASDEGADPTNTISICRTDRILSTLNGSGSSVHNQASVVTLDSDGYTLNFDVRNAADQFFVLSLKGGEYKVGSGQFKTSTGNQAYTGVGFQPVGLFLQTNGEAAGSTINDGIRRSFGAGDATNQAVAAYTDQDNVGTVVARRNMADSVALDYRSADGSTATAVAAINSLDSDGFTLNWTTATTGTRDFIYFAIGNTNTSSEYEVDASSTLSVSSAAARNLEATRIASSALSLTDTAIKLADDEYLVKVGSFLAATSTGEQSITGVGFQPKVVILFHALDEAEAVGSVLTSGWLGFGAAGETEQAAIGFNSRNSAAQEIAGIINRDDSAVILGNDTSLPGALIRGAITAFGADGFTIDWQTAVGTARVINYLAIGGSVLEEADVSTHQVPGATGIQAYTGVGFEPDAMILFGVSHGTLNQGKWADPMSMAIGFTDGVRQGVSAFAVDWNADPTDTYHIQRTNRIFATINGGPGSLHNEASLQSMDSDGFTLEWHTRNASDYFFAICLKGGRYHVGSDTQNTSIGAKATVGVPFLPSAVLFQAAGSIPTTSLQNQVTQAVGASDGLANVGNALMARHGVGTSVTRHLTSDDSVLGYINPSTQTIAAEATVQSMDDDGFTLDWSVSDGTGREFLYFAMGAPPERAESESELELDQDVGLNVAYNTPAESVLILVSEAVASGPRTGIATSVLELVQQAYVPTDKLAAASSLLALLSQADSSAKYVDAASILELVSLGDHSVKLRVAASILEFLDTATAVASKKARSILTLTQEADNALRGTATSSLLSLSQAATVPYSARSQLTLVSVADFVPPSAVKLVRSTLSLSQVATVMKVLGLSLTSALSLSHSVAVIVTGPSMCQYDPEGLPALDGPDDPTFTKGLKLSKDADEVEISRSMNLGDIDRLAFDRIYRETRGGTLVVFANPIWPKIETLVFTVSTVKRTKAQDVLTFLRTHLGQEVTLTTHEGREWQGVIMNPQSAVVEDHPNSFTINIEFEGTEVV